MHYHNDAYIIINEDQIARSADWLCQISIRDVLAKYDVTFVGQKVVNEIVGTHY